MSRPTTKASFKEHCLRRLGKPVVEINVDDSEIITRMSGRRVHQASGRTYHVKFNPPKIENVDDETGEPLIQRDDDQEETVKKRLKIYHESTFPLVEYLSLIHI